MNGTACTLTNNCTITGTVMCCVVRTPDRGNKLAQYFVRREAGFRVTRGGRHGPSVRRRPTTVIGPSKIITEGMV